MKLSRLGMEITDILKICAEERSLGAADQAGVVVIGRNEGKRLVDCLTSINPGAITTVYVDSGSEDGSVAAAKNLGAAVVMLASAQPFTAARARNEGFAALKALRNDFCFVQFVDGDSALDPRWLSV